MGRTRERTRNGGGRENAIKNARKRGWPELDWKRDSEEGRPKKK